jgi:taurine dioxygenase
MHIEPLTPHIGAIIQGVNLAHCSDHEFEAVYHAWYQSGVIFLRDQILTPKEHLSIAARFGELAPVHPFFPHVKDTPQISIIETVRGKPPLESFWHTDLTWQQRPSKASLLHAQHLPQVGGDTIWCAMIAVFNALSDTEKQTLRSLKTMHALHAFENIDESEVNADWHKEVIKTAKANPPVEHPMVTLLPETGEEVLFINEQFTRYVIGLQEAESRALLNKLFSLARQPEYQVRFKWQPNSLAIWDNRSTQHYAVIDYGDTPRKHHRVTVY